jgi:hypothetical protein
MVALAARPPPGPPAPPLLRMSPAAVRAVSARSALPPLPTPLLLLLLELLTRYGSTMSTTPSATGPGWPCWISPSASAYASPRRMLGGCSARMLSLVRSEL